MNHIGRNNHEAMRAYEQRSYQCSELDDRHFEALNKGDCLIAVNGYCLDALDHLPAGSMRALGKGNSPMWNTCMTEVCRGITQEEIREREALAERLIAEILAEEDAA